MYAMRLIFSESVPLAHRTNGSNLMAHDLQQALNDAIQQVKYAEQAAGRQPGSVTLLPVSKTKPIAMLAEAIQLGVTRFGENYIQELADKAQHFADAALEWHFIGPIQSNKTRILAEHADWVQSIDRLKIAQRLNDQRPADKPPLNICIQINVSREPQKAGVLPEDLPEMLAAIAQMPRLKLRGLMAIPAATDDTELQKLAFSEMQDLFEQHQDLGENWDTLSMGMSNDLETAIACGSNMVRIGTAIFGSRN